MCQFIVAISESEGQRQLQHIPGISMNQREKSTEKGQKEPSISAARRVYLDLRQRIIDMVLLPGSRIVEHDIAAEHGTSRTPVHEAVQRLAEEGLIEIRPRVGTFVSRIPLDGLDEAMLVRSALELAVVGKAAQRSTAEGAARLREILEEQRVFVSRGKTRDFHVTDEAFHEALATIAGHPRVWPLILQAKTQIDRYRCLTLQMPGRMEQVLAEHDNILKAIETGDVMEAVQAMRQHLDHVLPGLEHALSMKPEYFIEHLPGYGEEKTPKP